MLATLGSGEIMGKYDDVETRIIKDIEFKVPFRCFGVKMDPDKVMEILSSIPYECGRLMTEEEVLVFYE